MTDEELLARIGRLAESIRTDRALRERFRRDPAGTVEQELGVRLPEGMAEQIIAGIRKRLSVKNLYTMMKILKKFR